MFRRAWRLAAVITVLATVLAFAPVAFAGTQGSCSSPGSSGLSIRVFENSIGDTSDGNDSLWLACNVPPGNIVSNLGLFTHTLSGSCKAPIKLGDNWNDCLSSYQVWLPSSLWVVCFYQDSNYGGLSLDQRGPFSSRGNFNSSAFNDKISSIRSDNDGSC